MAIFSESLSEPRPSRFGNALRLAAFGMLAVLWGCSGSGDTATEGGAVDVKLVLTGSSTVAPLAAEIGKRFEKLHPGVRVDVQTGGSSRGVADARQGGADIGMASRALKPAEQDLLSFTIAQDGIAMIVHADNPIATLSNAQVVAIYTGKIRNWSKLGGADRPITVVNKAEGHSTLELFLHHFKLKGSQVKADVVIGDNQQGIKTVAGNTGAVGYVSIGSATYSAANGVPIRPLPMDGIEASVETLAAGQFPMARPLNLVTKETPTGWAKTFIDFARSDAVHDLVKAQYFVPVSG